MNNKSTDSLKNPSLKNEWESSEFLMIRNRLDQSIELLNIDPSLAEPMRHPKRCLTVTVPARMDDGTVCTFAGYRVHHDIALGPSKGGIAYSLGVNLGEVAAVAMLMSWKCAIMQLPYGGAHGGICLDPSELSKQELERVTRRYTSEIISLLGPDQDIPGPDLNTNQQTMAWIMDTYSVNRGFTIPSVVTGKPKSIGGSVTLIEATGHGVARCTKIAANHFQLLNKTQTVIIQGLGTVGSIVARNLDSRGFTVTGVSDRTGGIYNPKGISLLDLQDHINKNGNLKGFSGGNNLSNEELLEQECDILVPCAVPNVIHKGNASRLKCQMIVEGANYPVTPDADNILEDRNIYVVPDIIANASGVTAGYFEWVQGLMRLFWTEAEVLEKLDQLIDRACDSVFQQSYKKQTNLRLAATSLAVERIYAARQVRGLYP
jgi:glutamate dehydrogenase (NAD(P)+)